MSARTIRETDQTFGEQLVIENIEIRNFKSIKHLNLELGRINVFIGENGAGKSNILEAIALAGAAQARKLDNEFLASRGIRVTNPEFMRSAFSVKTSKDPIEVSVKSTDGAVAHYTLSNDNEPYSTWSQKGEVKGGKEAVNEFLEGLKRYFEDQTIDNDRKKIVAEDLQKLFKAVEDGEAEGAVPELRLDFWNEMKIDFEKFGVPGLREFVIFSPENTALRRFEQEGQIEPLGINGEGLLKLLTVMANSKDRSNIKVVKECLSLLTWFGDFAIDRDSLQDIQIKDNFISGKRRFDQRSANEGFLFVAFYFALFSSRLTPHFFAIDNIDASLNPRLCQALMEKINSLSAEFDKQALLTTHNPAILDGINLDDDQQRLFIVSRGRNGETRARRFIKKAETLPTRLSTLFLSGALGALPKGF